MYICIKIYSDYSHTTLFLISLQPLIAQDTKNKEGCLVLNRALMLLPLRLATLWKGSGKNVAAGREEEQLCNTLVWAQLCRCNSEPPAAVVAYPGSAQTQPVNC